MLPLLKLLRKSQPWIWGFDETDAFDRSKAAFVDVTMLKHPNLNERYYVCMHV